MGYGRRRRGLFVVAGLLCSALPWLGSDEARAVTATARFDRLMVEDGLSQGSANCIAQDAAGFIWFGTQDGLNRYDGYEFTVFRHDPERPGSLAHNFVWDLLVDADGSLWVATNGGGLDRMDPDTGEFAHLTHDASDPASLPNDRVRALQRGTEGQIWVGTDSGVAHFDPATGRFHRLVLDPGGREGAPAERVTALLVDRGGALWVGTDGSGLARFEPRTGALTRYRTEASNPVSLSSDRVRSLLEGPDGALWVGTYDGGLNRLDPATGRFRRNHAADGTGLAHDRVRSLLNGSDGSVWVGTDGGLNRIKPDAAVMVHYRHEASDPHSLANNRVLSLFQDAGGVVWVATQGGVSRWNPDATWFEHIRQSASDPSGLGNSVVNAIGEGPDGRLWIGTFGGLSVLDRESGEHHLYRSDPSDRSSISDDRVMALRWTRDGSLWVGTFGGGLNRFDPTTGRFTRFRSEASDPRTLGSDGVTSIHEDADGRLWVGCYGGGLNLLDRATGRVTRFRAEAANSEALGDDRVMTIAGDRSGALWIGTDGGGLHRFDPHRGTFQRFVSEPGGLTADSVWSILEGKDGTLWLGTQGGGLLRWTPEDLAAGRYRLRAYGERSGLPNAFVYGILEDEGGNLWLSTNRGLSRFDPESETFRNFGLAAGLQGLEFNFGAYSRASSGEMFFGGSNGLNAFHPSKVRVNDYVPPVRLTGILGVEGPMPLSVPPWRLDRLTLGHRDRVVAFEFAALDYTAPLRTRYAYRLDGFDDDWIELGTTRRATYTNLPAGEYTLRVRTARSDGSWNEAGFVLPLTIDPPPWATGWAWSLYVLLGAAGLLGLVRLQTLRERRREEDRLRLEEQVRIRTAELAEANAQLREASLTDPLTGLRNRRYVLTTIRDEMSALVRDRVTALHEGRGETPGRRALFVMIDLDGFKEINDTFGHEAGDRVLLEVRDRLAATCRVSDTVVRWGGDEFLLICRNTGTGGAEHLAEKILRTIASTPIPLGNGAEEFVGCSIGFAFYPFVHHRPDATSWEAVQMMADSAMYEAKRGGKNRWVGFFHETDRPDLLPPDLRGDLPEALPESLPDPGGIRIVRRKTRVGEGV
jgi:diguanylate cyclase (GGDEF)-like protein